MTKPLPETPELEPLTRIQILIAMGATAIFLLIISRVWLYFSPLTLMRLRWSVEDLLLGLGIGLGITAASSVIYRLWAAYQRSADYYLALVLKPLVWADLIWLGLLPGLSEELFFRGVLLPELGLDIFGVIVSGICFGVLHLSGRQQWAYVVWASVVGMLLGYTVVATGNLLVPIVAHICANFVAGCLWKFSNR